MVVDPIETWRAELDEAEKLASKALNARITINGDDVPLPGPAMMLQLVAGQRLVLQELEAAYRREQIEFVEQREAPADLPDAKLLPGLRRAAELLAEALNVPQKAVLEWLERAADHWERGLWERGISQPARHPLVASLFVSLDVPDVDAFQTGVLYGPQNATVVFTATLHDDTTVETRRQVRMQVTPS